MSELVLDGMLCVNISKHRLKLNKVLCFRSFSNNNNFIEIDRIIVFLALLKTIRNFSEFFIEAVLIRSWNFHNNGSTLFQQFQSFIIEADSFSDSS